MKRKNKIFNLFIITLIIISTVLFSLIPDFHPERSINQSYSKTLDMILHSGHYLTITILISLTLPKINNITILFSLLSISTFLEICQIWVIGRSFIVFDLVSNIIGITIGIILIRFYNYFKISNKNII